jgi:hypothetical protein
MAETLAGAINIFCGHFVPFLGERDALISRYQVRLRLRPAGRFDQHDDWLSQVSFLKRFGSEIAF